MKKKIKSLLTAAALTVGASIPLISILTPSEAQAHGSSCAPMLSEAFQGASWSVVGSGITARKNGIYYSSFTMSPEYQVESGLANPSAKANRFFEMRPTQSREKFTGKFVQVFTDRGNGDEDLTTLNISRSGEVEVILNKWNNTSQPLSNVSCLPGHTDKDFILLSTHTNGNSTKVLSFVISPQTVAQSQAWVWADQPTRRTYTPSQSYQYNSTGATNQITRLGQGKYSISLPKLSTVGGGVQVSAYGGNHQCKVNSWSPTNIGQALRVSCFDPMGKPVDARFTALFYQKNAEQKLEEAYLWANEPTKNKYLPSSNYQWNSKGLNNEVRRLNTGRYQAILKGMNNSGGTVLVTAYGTGPEQCKVVNWMNSNSDTLVNVACFDASGRPVDTKYTLSYKSGIQNSKQQLHGGYVWADKPTTASYTPSRTYQDNTVGETSSISRASVGSYTVRFPKLKSLGLSTAQVTAYGSNTHNCTLRNWGGSTVNVNCFDDAGKLVDSQFTLTYLTGKSSH